jgi:cytochrome P450
MATLTQSPTDPAFVQNPYPFYERARAKGTFFHWADYGMVCTGNAAAVNAIFRDRRFGREAPSVDRPAHLAPFYAVEAHSMLELEPPRHTRLVIIIARLLGVPESMAPALLAWSNAMVGMYQARRTRGDEDRAIAATNAFTDFLRGYIADRRRQPADDLITHLIAAEEDGAKLSTDELISTCILLLNAGHEATVHTIGNGVKALLETGLPLGDPATGVEEILRFDPALHMFTRWCTAPVTIMGQDFQPGDQVALLLAAANRDPALWDDPARFDPTRPPKPHVSFGAGLHFCVGAPLARLELQVALPILFERQPALHITKTPVYANVYHFHGLESLILSP